MEAFRADPKAFARRRGLKGKDATLLATMPVKGAAYFASRRVIDRHHYLRGDVPITIAAFDALPEAQRLQATYFVDAPYAKEDPRAEVRQFIAWAKKAGRKGDIPAAVADLAVVEGHGMLLADQPATRPYRHKVLRLRHDAEALLTEVAAAPQKPTIVALVREEDDVEMRVLSKEEAAALVARKKNGPAVAHLRKLGLL